MQELNKEGKTIAFIYKLKQNSLWTEYFCEETQTYTITNHSDFFGWGELFTLLFMYVGTRFLGLLSLDELLLQSMLGKNIRRHQPFDYDESFNLSIDDPRTVKHQSTQNVLSHWIPRFIIDCYVELVLEGNKKIHTITDKDPDTVLAPTLVTHLENSYWMKPKQKDFHGQTRIREFRHMIEEEKLGKEIRNYLSIRPIDHSKEYHDKFKHHLKLALQASPHIIQERIQ